LTVTTAARVAIESAASFVLFNLEWSSVCRGYLCLWFVMTLLLHLKAGFEL